VSEQTLDQKSRDKSARERRSRAPIVLDRRPISAAEASAGRCGLCHRSLVHPLAQAQDIERLGDEWGAALVHRSCAILAGLMRPAHLGSNDDTQLFG
jgi:hypothetical protein